MQLVSYKPISKPFGLSRFDSLGNSLSESLLSRLAHDDIFNSLLDGEYSYRETPESYIFEVSIPGFKANEVDVTLNSGKIQVSAQSKRGGEHSYYKEMYVSDINSVELDKGSAKLEDGILYITLPKSERARAKKIKVEA